MTQNCVFDTDTQGAAKNIVLYTRRLSSLDQTFKRHGKFSGDPERAARSYNASLNKHTRSSHVLVIDNLNCKELFGYYILQTSQVLHNGTVPMLLHIRYDTFTVRSITSNDVQPNTTSLTNIFIDLGLHVSIH